MGPWLSGHPCLLVAAALALIAFTRAPASWAHPRAAAGPAPSAAPAAADAAGIAFPGQYAPRPAGDKYAPAPNSCRRFTEPVERAACLEHVAFDFGRLDRYAAANAALAPPRPGERRVVFMGDSITDNWSRPAFGFFPGRRYINRGISSQTSAQMLLRFRADVIALKPRAVVILAGTNDIAGNGGATTPEAIQGNLASMAELARASGIKVVLASVLPVSDDKKDAGGRPRVRTKDRPLEALRSLNRWIAEYARRNRHTFLDYFSALADERGFLRPELNDDGLHPNAAGYAVMAPLAEKAIAAALRR